MQCPRCGNASLVPTSNGILDDLRSAFGKIRYRCTKCHRKTMVRVWPITKSLHARCPRCFSSYLQRWGFTNSPSLRRSIILWLGGSTYRCLDCSHAFVSLRRADINSQRSGKRYTSTQKDEPTEAAPETDGRRDAAHLRTDKVKESSRSYTYIARNR